MNIYRNASFALSGRPKSQKKTNESKVTKKRTANQKGNATKGVTETATSSIDAAAVPPDDSTDITAAPCLQLDCQPISKPEDLTELINSINAEELPKYSIDLLSLKHWIDFFKQGNCANDTRELTDTVGNEKDQETVRSADATVKPRRGRPPKNKLKLGSSPKNIVKSNYQQTQSAINKKYKQMTSSNSKPKNKTLNKRTVRRFFKAANAQKDKTPEVESMDAEAAAVIQEVTMPVLEKQTTVVEDKKTVVLTHNNVVEKVPLDDEHLEGKDIESDEVNEQEIELYPAVEIDIDVPPDYIVENKASEAEGVDILDNTNACDIAETSRCVEEGNESNIKANMKRKISADEKVKRESNSNLKMERTLSTEENVCTVTDLKPSPVETKEEPTDVQEQASMDTSDGSVSEQVNKQLVKSESKDFSKGDHKKMIHLTVEYKMMWVRFHGRVVIKLIMPEGNHFIMTEILRRCFRIKEPGKNKKIQHILNEKNYVLKIGDKELPELFYQPVIENLMSRQVIKTVRKSYSIIHEDKAKELFHHILGDEYCGSGCITKFTRQKSEHRDKVEDSDNKLVKESGDIEIVKVEKSGEDRKIKRKMNSKKRDRNIFDVIDLCSDDEIGYHSDTTEPYVDGKPSERLTEVQSCISDTLQDEHSQITDTGDMFEITEKDFNVVGIKNSAKTPIDHANMFKRLSKGLSDVRRLSKASTIASSLDNESDIKLVNESEARTKVKEQESSTSEDEIVLISTDDDVDVNIGQSVADDIVAESETESQNVYEQGNPVSAYASSPTSVPEMESGPSLVIDPSSVRTLNESENIAHKYPDHADTDNIDKHETSERGDNLRQDMADTDSTNEGLTMPNMDSARSRQNSELESDKHDSTAKSEKSKCDKPNEITKESEIIGGKQKNPENVSDAKGNQSIVQHSSDKCYPIRFTMIKDPKYNNCSDTESVDNSENVPGDIGIELETDTITGKFSTGLDETDIVVNTKRLEAVKNKLKNGATTFKTQKNDKGESLVICLDDEDEDLPVIIKYESSDNHSDGFKRDSAEETSKAVLPQLDDLTIEKVNGQLVIPGDGYKRLDLAQKQLQELVRKANKAKGKELEAIAGKSLDLYITAF